MGNFDLQSFVITLIVLVVSITLHEFGHAISADRLGDDTPRRQGRISLIPWDHFEIVGGVMMVISSLVGYGIGWGKPVQVNYRNFRNERTADIIVTACGPLMNLLLAILFALILRIGYIARPQAPLLSVLQIQFALSFVLINLSLMFFNLLPIFPLDGSHIVRRLLPPDSGERFYAFMVQWGPLILMIAILSGGGVLSKVIGPAVQHSMSLLLGLPPRQ